MRGRKPIPTRLKILRGRPSHMPLPRDEPKPERGIPPAPAELDEAELVLWQTMTSMLDKIGVLTVVDGAVLERYVAGLLNWRKAKLSLRRAGLVGKDEDGRLQHNPYWRIARDLEPILLAIEREFGLTPSARARLHVLGGEPKDAMDEFLRRPRSKHA